MPSAALRASPTAAGTRSTSEAGREMEIQSCSTATSTPHEARAMNQQRTAQARRQPRPMTRGSAAATRKAQAKGVSP